MDDIEGNDLSAVIAQEISAARNAGDTPAAKVGNTQYTKRELSGYYLRGDMPDLPARSGGSSQTSRDFADTLGWVLPGVVGVFAASDRMVQYDKVREENDDWSEDATEFTNYTFLRDNDGYRILYNATHDSLKDGNGVVCSYWEPPTMTAKLFRDQTDMELVALMEEGWQPTGTVKPGKPKLDLIEDPMTGDAVEAEVPTITARLQKEDKPGRISDATCLPENLLLNPTATTIESARFVAYMHPDKTRSDLMELADAYGWDKETIRTLGADKTAATRSVATDARNGDAYINDNSPFKSGDPIDLYECYVRYDKDGDGIAELVQAWFAGHNGQGAVLSDDEWDGDVPYTDIPCYPVPHRYEAESLFDRTADIARVKTTLLRQALDNGYAVGMPMREVERGSVDNPDILISPKFGGLIWKKPGSPPIVPHVIPFVADKSFVAMQYMDEMIAKRTGVSRTTMALDPEALQNQTATASQQQRDAGYSQIELIARNMAELGWARFFQKRLRLAVKHGMVASIPSKRGEPVTNPDGTPGEPSKFRQIDATKWDPNMAVSINVGLGTGSRDRDMAMLNTIMAGQIGMAEKLTMMGMPDKAIEFIPKILMTAEKIAESSGLKNPDEFYPDFSDEDVAKAKEAAAQPKPDPAVALEEAKGKVAMELAANDAQVTMQVEQGKNQLAQQQAAVDSEAAVRREQAQLEADMMTKDKDRDNALVLEQMRQQGVERIKAAEMQLDRDKFVATQELEREKMAHATVLADKNNAARADMAKNKPQPGKQPNA